MSEIDYIIGHINALMIVTSRLMAIQAATDPHGPAATMIADKTAFVASANRSNAIPLEQVEATMTALHNILLQAERCIADAQAAPRQIR